MSVFRTQRIRIVSSIICHLFIQNRRLTSYFLSTQCRRKTSAPLLVLLHCLCKSFKELFFFIVSEVVPSLADAKVRLFSFRQNILPTFFNDLYHFDRQFNINHDLHLIILYRIHQKRAIRKLKKRFYKKRLLYSSCSSNKEASMLSELLKD